MGSIKERRRVVKERWGALNSGGKALKDNEKVWNHNGMASKGDEDKLKDDGKAIQIDGKVLNECCIFLYCTQVR